LDYLLNEEKENERSVKRSITVAVRKNGRKKTIVFFCLQSEVGPRDLFRVKEATAIFNVSFMYCSNDSVTGLLPLVVF